MSKYRPNYVYVIKQVREAADALELAGDVLFRGYQRGVPVDHPLLVALRALAEVDKEAARRANLMHDPDRFDCKAPAGAPPLPPLAPLPLPPD